MTGIRSQPAQRVLLLVYCTLGLGYSTAILFLSLQKGSAAAWYLGGLALLFLVWVFNRSSLFLVTATMIPLLGWTSTTLTGHNLSLISGLLSFAAALFAFDQSRERKPQLSATEAAALAFSFIIAVSTVFAIFRITSFSLMLKAGITTYPVNALGIGNTDVLFHIFSVAATLFSLAGVMIGAREQWKNPLLPKITTTVMAAMLLAMIYQKFVDPWFLLPRGYPPEFRLSGLTSYVYALGSLLVVSFAILPTFFRKRRIFILALTVAFMIPVILWSGSRLALISAGILLLVYMITTAIHFRKKLDRLTWKRVGIAALVAVLVLAGTITTIEMLNTHPRGTALSRLISHSGKDGFLNHLYKTRLNAYPLALSVIAEYPLTGTGIGTYYSEVVKQTELLMPPDYALQDPFNLRSNAPNLYLALATDAGLPAMAIFIVMWVSAVISGWLRARGARDDRFSLIKLNLIAAAAVLAFVFNIGPELYNGETIPFTAVLLAALAGGGRPRKGTNKSNRLLALGAVGLILIQTGGIIITGEKLSLDHQWKELGWQVDRGFYPFEDVGRWSGSNASWIAGKRSPAAIIKWFTGSAAATGYHPVIRFSVDGEEIVEIENATAGQLYETIVVFPAIESSHHVISVQVDPPYVPAEYLNTQDKRPLGIFVKESMSAPYHTLLGAYQKAEDNSWSWIGSQASILVRAEDQKLMITAQSGHHDLAKNPSVLRVLINNEETGRYEFTPEKREQVLEIPLVDVGDGIVTLMADRTFRPADFANSNDERSLSFKIDFEVSDR